MPTPVDRRAVEDALVALAADDGAAWLLDAPLDGGHQSGAWRVRTADGRVAVLKTSGSGWAEQAARAAGAVRVVRAAGYPTPDQLAHGTTRSGGYVLQELVPGTPVTRLDRHHAAALVEVVDRQAGLDPDPSRNWNDFVAGQLTSGRADLEQAASGAGPAGERLVDRCARLTAGVDVGAWPRTDMVHGDLRPGNVLVDGARVSGVVDIEAIGSGTRVYDLATLLSADAVDEDAAALIVAAAVRAADPDVLRACVAQVFLDLVRFVARNGGDPSATAVLLERRAAEVERLTG